jgi:hypothetical protein
MLAKLPTTIFSANHPLPNVGKNCRHLIWHWILGKPCLVAGGQKRARRSGRFVADISTPPFTDNE